METLTSEMLTRAMDRIHGLALEEDKARDAEDLARAEQAARESWSTREDAEG